MLPETLTALPDATAAWGFASKGKPISLNKQTIYKQALEQVAA